MKALVKETAGPGFKLKNVPEPKMRDDEVLIRVRCVRNRRPHL